MKRHWQEDGRALTITLSELKFDGSDAALMDPGLLWEGNCREGAAYLSCAVILRRGSERNVLAGNNSYQATAMLNAPCVLSTENTSNNSSVTWEKRKRDRVQHCDFTMRSPETVLFLILSPSLPRTASKRRKKRGTWASEIVKERSEMKGKCNFRAVEQSSEGCCGIISLPTPLWWRRSSWQNGAAAELQWGSYFANNYSHITSGKILLYLWHLI